MKNLTGLLAIVMPLLTLSCTTTREQALEYVQAGTDSVDRLTQSQYDAALALGGDPDVLVARESKFQEQVANQRARYAELEKEFEAQKQKLTNLITSLSSALLAGSNPASIAAAFVSRFSAIEERATALETTDITTSARIEASESAQERNAGQVESVSDKLASLDRKSSQSDGLIERLREKAEASAAQVQVNAEKLDAISDRTLQKLATLPANTIQDLEQLRSDRDRLLDEVARAASLTADERRELEGLSTEELLGLITAAIGAAAAGGVLGKTGRSRAQADVDSLRGEVISLNAKMDKIK